MVGSKRTFPSNKLAPILELPYPEEIVINEKGQCLCYICGYVVGPSTADVQKHLKNINHTEKYVRSLHGAKWTKTKLRQSRLLDIQHNRQKLWKSNKNPQSDTFHWPTLISDEDALTFVLSKLHSFSYKTVCRNPSSLSICMYTDADGAPSCAALYNADLVWILILKNISASSVSKALQKLMTESLVSDVISENVRDVIELLSQKASKGVVSKIRNLSMRDIQLGHEACFGEREYSLVKIAHKLNVKTNTLFETWYTTDRHRFEWCSASMSEECIHLMREHVLTVHRVSRALSEHCKSKVGSLDIWTHASRARARRTVGSYKGPEEVAISFDKEHFSVGSLEVLEAASKAASTSLELNKLEAKDEMELLLHVLPVEWADKIRLEDDRQLIDIEMDLERLPHAFFRRGAKLCLADGPDDVVTEGHLEGIQTLINDGNFAMGGDNRGGIKGCLHRISLIRSTEPERIFGATLRVGRHICGVSSSLLDVLLEEKNMYRSILLLGPPGSGKTTMLRDAARVLSKQSRVIIVDSSHEIGGPGIRPHHAVGDARRMLVFGGKMNMIETLIEAIENHTPDMLLVDELSNINEVKGVGTAKERGVRLVSSAHGDLRSLMKNSAMRGMLGGIEQVVLGDVMASRTERGKKSDGAGKLKAVRRSTPIFDIVVELGIERTDPSMCRIVHDVAFAVDSILEGKKYPCEIRWRTEGGFIMSRMSQN